MPTYVPLLPPWFADPVETHSDWLDTLSLAESSRVVRRAMWGKLWRYLRLLDRRLDDVEAADLMNFFQAEGTEKAQRYRYVLLVEGVYRHLETLGLGIRNPGTLARGSLRSVDWNDDACFLDAGDRRTLLCWLEQRSSQAGPGELVPRAGESAQSGKEGKKRKSRARFPRREWDSRDRALAAVMMGAGVSVREVGGITVNCAIGILDGGDELSLPATLHSPARNAYVFPFARPAICAWLQERRSFPGCAPDSPLFISNPALRPSDARAKDRVMDKATLYRAISHLFDRLQIDAARRGGQILRNSYAALLFDAGLSDDAVALHMGLVETHSAMRLRQVWEARSALGLRSHQTRRGHPSKA